MTSLEEHLPDRAQVRNPAYKLSLNLILNQKKNSFHTIKKQTQPSRQGLRKLCRVFFYTNGFRIITPNTSPYNFQNG